MTITFSNVVFRYPYDEFELLKGVDFTLTEGVNTVLCDAQSGKTTLCRLMLGLLKPTSGQISVDGKPLSGISATDLEILYLPRHPVVFKRRSVLYNVMYPLRVRKAPKAVARQQAALACDAVQLADVSVRAGKLSGEELRKLAIARGLTVPRRVVLFDDFLDAADPSSVKAVSACFGEAMQVIFTSDVRLANGHTVVLDGGKTVFEGDAAGAAAVVAQLYWPTAIGVDGTVDSGNVSDLPRDASTDE